MKKSSPAPQLNANGGQLTQPSGYFYRLQLSKATEEPSVFSPKRNGDNEATTTCTLIINRSVHTHVRWQEAPGITCKFVKVVTYRTPWDGARARALGLHPILTVM